MAQIGNLNKENLDGVKDFVKTMQGHSPEVTIKTYPMDEKPADVKELAIKIDALSAKIDLIFGDAILINGRFQHLHSKK